MKDETMELELKNAGFDTLLSHGLLFAFAKNYEIHAAYDTKSEIWHVCSGTDGHVPGVGFEQFLVALKATLLTA